MCIVIRGNFHLELFTGCCIYTQNKSLFLAINMSNTKEMNFRISAVEINQSVEVLISPNISALSLIRLICEQHVEAVSKYVNQHMHFYCNLVEFHR